MKNSIVIEIEGRKFLCASIAKAQQLITALYAAKLEYLDNHYEKDESNKFNEWYTKEREARFSLEIGGITDLREKENTQTIEEAPADSLDPEPDTES